VHQSIHRHEDVHQVRPEEERLGDLDACLQPIAGDLAEDRSGQEHPGRLAADAAETDAMAVDLLQTADGQPLLGDVDVIQLIADDAPDESHLEFGQMMFERGAVFGREALDAEGVLDQARLRHELRIEGFRRSEAAPDLGRDGRSRRERLGRLPDRAGVQIAPIDEKPEAALFGDLAVIDDLQVEAVTAVGRQRTTEPPLAGGQGRLERRRERAQRLTLALDPNHDVDSVTFGRSRLDRGAGRRCGSVFILGGGGRRHRRL
jgi:hypothetical protein